MKKGDNVKCVSCEHSDYLTAGKIYEVTHGCGDLNKFEDVIDGDDFQIVDDEGDTILDGVTFNVHAIWELVE